MMNGPMLEADRTEKLLKQAWKYADTPLSLDDF